MKYFTYSVLLLCIFSCSPKYTASFQDHNHSDLRNLATTYTQHNDVSKEAAGSVPPVPEFDASTESVPTTFKSESAIFSHEETKLSSLPSAEFKRHKSYEIKTAIKHQMDSPMEGNPKKNGFATAGLVFGVLSLIPLYGMLAIIPAIIFSIIGLKSEKRKSARIGLILAGIGIAIVLFIVSFSL
jgi:hypothetical protein